jgi:hypothetical protein
MNMFLLAFVVVLFGSWASFHLSTFKLGRCFRVVGDFETD